jgi:hypothetical protein
VKGWHLHKWERTGGERVTEDERLYGPENSVFTPKTWTEVYYGLYCCSVCAKEKRRAEQTVYHTKGF